PNTTDSEVKRIMRGTHTSGNGKGHVSADFDDSRSSLRNLDAEKAVLGSLMRDNKRIDSVFRVLQAEDFSTDAHQKILRGIAFLHGRKSPVDQVLLAEVLYQQGAIEDIGGYRYLADLLDAAPTAANAEYYAHIVHEKARMRNLIYTLSRVVQDARDS